MTGSSSDERDWPRVHALIERYTPDGWLGRLLLGVISGSVSVTLLFLALFGFTTLSFFWLLGGLFALAGGVATGVLGVVTLWPVYLSLIGNVESAAEYGPPVASSRASSSLERDAPLDLEPSRDEPDSDDPVALLKRRYAAGELSDEEFERRLDRLMETDERLREDAGSATRERDRIAEPDR